MSLSLSDLSSLIDPWPWYWTNRADGTRDPGNGPGGLLEGWTQNLIISTINYAVYIDNSKNAYFFPGYKAYGAFLRVWSPGRDQLKPKGLCASLIRFLRYNVQSFSFPMIILLSVLFHCQKPYTCCKQTLQSWCAAEKQSVAFLNCLQG